MGILPLPSKRWWSEGGEGEMDLLTFLSQPSQNSGGRDARRARHLQTRGGRKLCGGQEGES